jgi:Pyruvate/2-oxoacid:ferredoxin oxidoreductase delta subunit
VEGEDKSLANTLLQKVSAIHRTHFHEGMADESVQESVRGGKVASNQDDYDYDYEYDYDYDDNEDDGPAAMIEKDSEGTAAVAGQCTFYCADLRVNGIQVPRHEVCALNECSGCTFCSPTEAPTPAPTMASTYFTTDKNVAVCPGDSIGISTLSECQSVGVAMNLPFGKHKSWKKWPSGCFIAKDRTIHFNTNPVGRAHRKGRVVCKTQPAPTVAPAAPTGQCTFFCADLRVHGHPVPRHEVCAMNECSGCPDCQ